jgi:DNA-binding MurR/RpiR family transcriptional regulator
MIRPEVIHIQSTSNAWPHYLLEVNTDDVIVIFDIRRYENSTLRLAEMAAERNAKIVLFTDQWTSPVAQIADITLRNRISVPSAWDSNVTSMLVAEILIAQVQERDWETTRTRMEALEDMFDRTRFFRKF